MERRFGDRLISGYDVSRDDRVVAAVPDANGRSRLWIEWLDGSEPAVAVPGVEGNNPRWAGPDEIVYLAVDRNSTMLARVRTDGMGRREVSSVRGSVLGTVSPDGQWVSVHQSLGRLLAHSTIEATAVPILEGLTSRLRWNADGSYVYLSVQELAASAFANGRTYVLPLRPGSVLPPMPPEGFRTEADVAAVPSVQVLPHGDFAPGPTAAVYSFSRTTTTRNLYCIPLARP